MKNTKGEFLKILLVLIAVFGFVACDRESNQVEKVEILTYNVGSIGEDESRFHLLKNENATIYALLSAKSGVMSENLGRNAMNDKMELNQKNLALNGNFYVKNEHFGLRGEVAENGELRVNIYMPNDYTTPIGGFIGIMLNDGTMEVEFVKESQVVAPQSNQVDSNQTQPNQQIEQRRAQEGLAFADLSGKQTFAPARDLINDVKFVSVRFQTTHIGKDYDGSDREYSYTIEEQGGLIQSSIASANSAIKAINAQIGGKMSDIPSLRNALLDKIRTENSQIDENFNVEKISHLSVDYVDSEIIAFENFVYEYRGGAHGNYGHIMTFYSLKDGEILSNEINSLLKDENDETLKKLIISKFGDSLPSGVDAKNPSTINLSKFKIKENGIEFYWGIYEIASYADGIISVVVPFDELREFVREDSPYFYLFTESLE